MSKNFKKYFLNNLKETTYLSNIDRVEFDSTKTDGNDMLSDSQLQQRRENLDKIQIRDRHNNMRIYVKNMLDFRMGQLFTLVVPTALVVGTVASFVVPYRRAVDKKFTDVIVKESTILSNIDGQITDNSQVYYHSENFLSLNDYKFVNENEDNYKYQQDKLIYQISNGIDSAIAKFSYDSNGKLSFNGVDVGKYIDINEYDFSEASKIDEKYEILFDEVLNLIKSESNDLSAEFLDVLDQVSKSEDRKIIIDIVKYNNIGPGTTKIYKTRLFQRIILSIVTGLYGLCLFFIYQDGELSKGNKLYSLDGRLCEEQNQTIGYWHVGLKYKEAFIRAEVDRIKRAHELATEYVNDEEIEDLFTRFERKLTLGNKKER